jgi:hypothetical protein
MAVRLFLALIAVAAIMWYLGWYQRADPEARRRSLRSATLYGIGIGLLLLVVTGRIPWLFALFSAAVPWINRALTMKRLWNGFRPRTGDGHGPGGGNASGGRTGNRPVESMTREEALEILGLSPGARRQEIIDAHRKLMSRVHPDKGGSDYLARSINQARKVLLDDIA